MLMNRNGAVKEPNCQVAGKPAFRYQSSCHRCGGAGGSKAWEHTGYTCYECGGSGKGAVKVAKLYDQAQLDKLNTRAAKAAAKKAAKAAAEFAAEQAARAARRGAFLERYKAELAKAEELAAAEREGGHMAFWNDFLASIVDRASDNGMSDRQIEVIENGYAKLLADRERVANSVWVGAVGDRIKKAPGEVVFSKHICTVSQFPLIERYLVKIKLDSGADLVWWAGHGEGLGRCLVSATVKEHSEFNGAKQTVVARVMFNEIPETV